MSTIIRTVGHTTLKLAQIAPEKSAAYSPNLHQWMRAKAHFYKDGGVLQTVYRVKPGTLLAKELGEGTLMIGYPDNGNDKGFTGIRLMATLCQGAKAGSFYYIGMARMLEEINGFWDQYLSVGRCAIDPAHEEGFLGERFSLSGDTRTCLWCGSKHDRVLTPRTVFDESWKSV